MHRGLTISAVAAVAMMLVVSCVKVSFNDDNLGGIIFDAAYPDGMPSSTYSDSVFILMSRALSEVHYADTLETSGAKKEKTLRAAQGEYYISAFAVSPGAYDVSGMEQFIAGIETKMQDVRIKIIPLSDGDVIERFGGYLTTIDDDFVTVGTAAPAGLVTKSAEIQASDSQLSRMHLDLQDPRVHVSFVVHVHQAFEDSAKILTVEKAVGCLTGVPSEIGLFGGYVTKGSLGKVLFDLTKNGSSEGPGTFEGAVDVLGAFTAFQDGYAQGPGILRVAMDVSVNGVRKVVFPYANIKSALDNADILKDLGDGLNYTVDKRNVALEVDIEINEDTFENGKDGSMSDWVDDDTDIDVEI